MLWLLYSSFQTCGVTEVLDSGSQLNTLCVILLTVTWSFKNLFNRAVDYWVSRFKTAPTAKMRKWLGHHAEIAKIMRKMTSVRVELDEYLGTAHLPGSQVPAAVRASLRNDDDRVSDTSCRIMYVVTFGQAPKGCICKSTRLVRRVAIWAWTECTHVVCMECDVCKCVIGCTFKCL